MIYHFTTNMQDRVSCRRENFKIGFLNPKPDLEFLY